MRWSFSLLPHALVPIAAFLGCTATPDLQRPEEPFGGKIFEEQSMVIGTSEVTTELLQKVRITIPATAYPAGTRVTLRIVEPRQLGDSPIVLGKIIRQDPARITLAALQILPANPSPTLPLLVHVQMPAELAVPPPSGTIDPLMTASYGLDLLYARESDGLFTTTAQDQLATGSGANRAFNFAIDKPGLWTLAQWPIPAGLQGRWVYVWNASKPALLSESIDLVGRGYTWARTDTQGCVSIETGSLSAPRARSLECRSNSGVTTSHSLDVTGRGLMIDGKSLQFQPDNQTPLVAGCPMDEGPVPDAGGVDALAETGQRHD